MNSGALTINDFIETYRVGRTRLYELLAEGAIVARKSGSRTLIDRDTAAAWFKSLPEYRPAHNEVLQWHPTIQSLHALR